MPCSATCPAWCLFGCQQSASRQRAPKLGAEGSIAETHAAKGSCCAGPFPLRSPSIFSITIPHEVKRSRRSESIAHLTLLSCSASGLQNTLLSQVESAAAIQAPSRALAVALVPFCGSLAEQRKAFTGRTTTAAF